ncbi:protein PF3D7_1417600-like [Helicoverpa zea]|uniref:protein PF3D7_1417600-like n=1 Tax=Helicoverpa zea TaxID=7113 RepID=UPI001F55F779|nr:protein PF3D7_1417600-like [Helicoverpa zea]
MWRRESYFSQYVSPNIVIVPTVSFGPPEANVKASDPITNPPNCEQTNPKDCNSNLVSEETILCKDNVTSVDMNPRPKAIESTRASDNIQISPVRIPRQKSPEVPSYHTSPRLKEFTTAQYKSRNRLVDFTGFNRLKWDRGHPSSEYRDSRRRDTYYESDTMMSDRETDYRKSSEKYTTKSLKMIDKEPTKRVKPSSIQSKKKVENITKSDEIESDMTEKMKKCFKELWKRNLEKLKAKSAKEKREKLKRSKEHSKTLKPEPVRSKSHLEGVTKNTTSKNIRNKILDKSKKKHDLERSRSEEFKKSRSVTNATRTADSKDSKIYLSPISMKRYQDFQEFIRQNDNNDDENKNRTKHDEKKKPDRVYKKKISTKSCETITKTKSDTKTKVIERKEVFKKETTKKERHTEIASTSQNKIDRVKPIKSVVQTNNLSQKRFANVEEDLRFRLSRKRSKSDYETSSTQQSGDTKTDQEKEKIRLNQDAKADSKISKVDKPKKKKVKLIIINIECPDSDDSEDRNSSESPQDLSFLDDINVDEIVDSLNDGQIQVEQNVNEQSSAANAMLLIKDKTNEYDHKNEFIEGTEVESSMNIDDKEEIIEIKEDERSEDEEVISIDSDSNPKDGDLFVKNGSSAKKNLQEEQVMKTSSHINKNIKQRSSKITESTIKRFQVNVHQNVDKSNETKTSVSEVITIEDDSIDSENTSTANNSKYFESNKSESKVDQILELLTRSTKRRLATEITNKSQSSASTSGIKKSKSFHKCRDANRENMAAQNHSESKVDDNGILSASEKPSIQAKMNQLRGSINDVTAQQVSASANNTKAENIQVCHSSDPVEASLESMFNGKKRKTSEKQIPNEANNTSVEKVKDHLYKSNESVETSLSKMFSDNKQVDLINKVIEEPNLTEKYMKKEASDNADQMLDLNANIRVEQINAEHPEVIPKTAENNTVQKFTRASNSDPLSQNIVSKTTKKAVIQFPKSLASENKKAVHNAGKEHLSQSVENFNKAKGNMHLKTLKEPQRTPTKGNEIKTNPVVKPPENNNKNIGKVIQNDKNVVEKTPKKTKSTPQTVKQHTQNQSNKPKELAKLKDSVKNPHDVSSKSCGKTIAKIDIKASDKREKIKSNTTENVPTSNQQISANDRGIKDKELTSTNKKSTKIVVNLLQKQINKELKNPNNQCEKKEPSNIKDAQAKNKAETNVTNKTEHLQKTTGSNKPVEKTANATKEIHIAENPSVKSCVSSESESNNSTVNKAGASSNSNKQDTKKKNEPKETYTKAKDSAPLKVQKQEEVKNDIQSKNANEELSKNYNTNKEIPSGTNSAMVKKANNDQITKTRVLIADSKNKSLEKDKNDTQKPSAGNNLSKANSTAIKVPNKTGEVIKRDENVPNSNKKEEAKVNTAAEAQQKKDDIGKKLAKKADNLFKKRAETVLCQNLNTRTELLHTIQNGRFSAIHKCSDTNGNTYALKVMREPFHNIGPEIEYMLFGLQAHCPMDIPVVHLICTFEVMNQYCLLTEFYPKNLVQALQENQRGFNINLVQILSKQLVDAVNMLTVNNIVHADIKPGHILLNSSNDKLKLCGFDRSGYYDSIKIYPSTGTCSYRAPEIILGFPEYQRIDVWSTALIMFKMATNTDLFSGIYNNEIIYQHLCTLGSFDCGMVEESKFKHRFFDKTSFKLRTGPAYDDMVLIHIFQESDRLRQQLFSTYVRDWEQSCTWWQMTNDLDKLESLHALLAQMLELDPRHRLPIQFVAVSEFLNNFSLRNF